MRELDLTTLRLFVAVCDARSMAKAGEQANMVGSAISKRLAQLEDTVGTPLLVRKRRGMEPTAAGQTLLEHARGMLASTELIARDMAAYASGTRGQVRLLATASVMAESLADDVAAFLQQPGHQDIQIDIEERLSTEVVRGILGGSASLGLCWVGQHAADLRGLQSRPYRSDHLSIVAHPAHPLAGLGSVRFEQTLDFEHVSLPVTSAVQVMLQRAAAEMGRSVKYRVIVANFESALRVVRANLAISVVPQEVALPYALAHNLRVIALDEPWAERHFAISFKDEQSLSSAARLLLAHLQTCSAAAQTTSTPPPTRSPSR
jgi:DNA-binding transcriptional LysR family regulator